VIPQVIYGLPGVGLSKYCQSFDSVYELQADEIGAYHLLVLRDTQFYSDRGSHRFICEEAPPHRLVANATFREEDIVLAGKMSCVAMGTQYFLRRYIKDYCQRGSMTTSHFFLKEVDIEDMDDALAFSFSIYNPKKAELLEQCLWTNRW
jgi:hypothetical protein